MIWDNSEEHYLNVFKKNNLTDQAEIQQGLKCLRLKSKNDLQKLELVRPKAFQAFWTQLTSAPKVLLFPRYNAKASGDRKKVRTIIMGQCGNGKTSFLNNICGTRQSTGQGMFSLTRDLCEFPSKYIQTFTIVDTPGTNSKTDQYEHAYHLKAALQWGQYNTIFIQAKYQTRGQQLISDIKRNYKMVQPFKENIIFLVSNIDRSQNPQKLTKQICSAFQKQGLNQQVIFYSNTQVYPRVLAQVLYDNVCQMPAIKMQIEQIHFLKTFHLQKSPTDLKDQQKQAIDKMDSQTQLYIQTANGLVKDSEKQAIRQDLALNLKCALDQIFMGYCNKFRNTMQAAQTKDKEQNSQGAYHSMYYTLQRHILTCDQNFNLKTRPNTSEKYSQVQNKATGDKKDITDLIKQCPNPQCGLIWFRVQACPNTSCGSRPSCFWDFRQAKQFCRYTFQKINGFLKMSKKQQKTKSQFLMKDGKLIERAKFQQEVRQIQKTKPKIGCGQAMNFDTLPKIPHIQTKLMQWFMVSSFDQISSKLKTQQDLKQFRDEVESKVLKSIKSLSQAKGQKYQIPTKQQGIK